MSVLHQFLVACILIFCVVAGEQVKNVLLLGGNGFIGSHVSLALLAQQSRTVNVTVVSRGNWPYDTSLTVLPRVSHVACDRYQSKGLRGCPDLMTFVQNSDYFDALVDFSAYEPQVVKDALDVFKGKIGIYIYISSDSVYEVCEASGLEKSSEENAVRPSDPKLRRQLADSDSYGDLKLLGETVLESLSSVPYVTLRLPDVMGPRDSTGRWWFYVLWTELYHSIGPPLPVPPHSLNLSTSYVYAPDVANVITDIILERFDSSIHRKAFNLGFEESHTLSEILLEISSIMKVDVEIASVADCPYMLPSVTRGAVDISRAKKFLNFVPTDWKQALNRTVTFYANAFYQFPKERGRVVEKLLRLVISDHNKLQVLSELESRNNIKGNCILDNSCVEAHHAVFIFDEDTCVRALAYLSI